MEGESGGNGVLEALVAALRDRAQYNSNEQVAPATILWPDKERQWESVLPLLREHLPALLTLGSYDPDTRTGPAIWLRCMLARTLDEANWDESEVPILYLSGISRQELRAVENCPPLLQPIAELQYRGEFWSQSNARDWTVFAFLKSSDGGLGLDVAKDDETLEALARALQIVITTPIDRLRNGRLEAADFDMLLSGDPIRDILDWLDQPIQVQERWGPERWQAFCSRCNNDYKLKPQTDGELTGAELLSKCEGNWANVWNRFSEAPEHYPNLPALLEKIPGDMFASQQTLPHVNRQEETTLRQALMNLADMPPHEATPQILELEEQHGKRRRWVWAFLEQAPLAQALTHLNRLASIAGAQPSFSTLEEAANYQIETGSQADMAVLEALQAVRQEPDIRAVICAIRSVYGHWLDETAQCVQKRVAEEGYPGAPTPEDIALGTCILFADGLRLDIGQKLGALLERRGLTVQFDTTWAALPTVTSTAKPALSPVASQITGTNDAKEFQPIIAQSGQESKATNFRKLLAENEWQVLDKQEEGTPEGRGWTEYGSLDRYGHDQGWKLAWRIDEELSGLIGRITVLLEAGWKHIRVQTDHGWLLYPGTLPKQDMPTYLVKSRWGRCALLKEGASYDGLTAAWHWCNEVRIAMPKGMEVFYAGNDYSHGGISLQECLIPILTISADSAAPQSVLEEPIWRRLVCRVSVQGVQAGMRVDLRTKPADAASSIAKGGKELSDEGKASLMVEDDDQEGAIVSLVLIDVQDRVVAKLPTTVGGE